MFTESQKKVAYYIERYHGSDLIFISPSIDGCVYAEIKTYDNDMPIVYEIWDNNDCVYSDNNDFHCKPINFI